MLHSDLPINQQKPISLIPEDCDYNVFCDLRDIKDDILNFVESGKNLFICGPTGNGKTSWAIKLLTKYFDEIWAGNGFRTRGLFIHVPTLLLKAKDFSNPLSSEYKQNIMDADLVVWDEIGAAGLSNYDFNQLLMYIDHRMLTGKSNIYTTNLITQNDLVNVLGERLASRVNSATVKIRLQGKDRRHDSASNNK